MVFVGACDKLRATMPRQLTYPLLVIVLPFIMYVQLWHGSPAERQWVLGDPGDSYWPDLAAIELAFAQGDFPLWNPYERGGIPFAADPQPGLLYPLNWLLALYGWFAGGVSFGLLQFKLLIHFSIAGLGMYLFMRDRGQPGVAAAVAGLAYELGGWFPFNIWGSLNWPVAWAPWLLRAIDRVMRDPRRGTAAELAVVAALTVHAGSPPSMYYTCLMAVPYFVYRLVGTRHGLRFGSWAKRFAPSLLGSGLLAGILSAPQLLATVKLTKHTALDAPPFSHAASGALGVDDLLVFLLPSGSDMYLYMGATALFLSIFALHHRAFKDVAFFAALALVGTLLTLGSSTQVFRLFYELVPGFRLFRLAYRYASLVSLALSVLAGYGTASLVERLVPKTTVRNAGYGVGTVALLAIWLRIAKDPVKVPALAQDTFVVALLLGVTWCIVYVLREHERSAAVAGCLLGIVVLDYAMHIPRAPNLRPGTRERPQYISPGELAQLRRDVSGYRIYNEFALDDRAGSKLQLRDFRGYMDPLAFRRYGLILGEQLRPHPVEILRLFNVRYVLFSQHGDHGMSHHFIPHPQTLPGLTQKTPHIFEVTDPAPNAYWADRVQLAATDDDVRRRLFQLDYRQGALLAHEDLSPEQLRWARTLKGQRPVAPARVVSRNYNQVTFQAEAPADGLLVVNEPWFEGWRAEVDGKQASLVRVNSLMQGVPLKRGSHRVVMRFRPYYYIVPATLAALTLLGLLAMGLFHLIQSGGYRRAFSRLRTLSPDTQH